MAIESVDAFFLQLMISDDHRFRVTRHIILWFTALSLIGRSFHFVASSIPQASSDVILRYTVFSTVLFGAVTAISYWVLTLLTRRYILLRFQLSQFILSVLLVHMLNAEIVLWHFSLFTNFFTLDRLPRFYTKYTDHVAHLQFWQAPFDSVIVWFFSFSLFYNYLLYLVGLKAFKDLFVLKRRQNELEKENLRLELNFLKAQINPHFLFNTLNNIYSFSIKAPGKVTDTILKLANLMRYSLYETNEDLVPLSHELLFLTSYIELQQIRHDDNVQIQFNVYGQPGVKLIPPLLLIIFVENAFKHGLQATAQASWVRIDLTITATTLVLQVVNSIPFKTMAKVGGIGLKNVSKRLAHFYANNHQLTIEDLANQFSIRLTIPLDEPLLSDHYRG